jgi:hypothetical protein
MLLKKYTPQNEKKKYIQRICKKYNSATKLYQIRNATGAAVAQAV